MTDWDASVMERFYDAMEELGYRPFTLNQLRNEQKHPDGSQVESAHHGFECVIRWKPSPEAAWRTAGRMAHNVPPEEFGEWLDAAILAIQGFRDGLIRSSSGSIF